MNPSKMITPISHMRLLTRRPGIFFTSESKNSIANASKASRRHVSNPSSRPSRLEFVPPDRSPPSEKLQELSSLRKEANPSASIWNSVKTAFGFKATHKVPEGYTPAPFTVENNPYRAKKTWPPNFSRLTPRHRFYFEKKYRRRAKLKYSCPGWRKGVTIVQNVSIAATIIYFVFFLKLDDGETTPFDGVRVFAMDTLRSVWGNEPEDEEAAARRRKRENMVVEPQRAR